MRMNIETKTVLSFLPDTYEVIALGRTDSIVSMLQDKMTEDNKIMALATGEIITYDDLCRVRGILSGLMDNYQWAIMPTKEN